MADTGDRERGRGGPRRRRPRGGGPQMRKVKQKLPAV